MLKICGTCEHCTGDSWTYTCSLSNLQVDTDHLCEQYCPVISTDNTSIWKINKEQMVKDAIDAIKEYEKNTGTALDATHYQILQQQPIEIMQVLMTHEQFLGFCWGNAIKYILRLGKKDAPEKEMQKAQQYAKWYIEASKGKIIDPRE